VKNTGAGPTRDATVVLRNGTGDGVVLKQSREELKTPLAPGQVRELSFALATEATLKADEMVVELIAYDADLDVDTRQKLRFKVLPGVAPTAARGEVTVKAPVVIRAGASDQTEQVGNAPKGASYTAIASFGSWTKVKLDARGRIGFVPSAAITSGGSGAGAFTQAWNSTPPVISLTAKDLETTGETYRVAGSVSDEEHVEDVYVFVSNDRAKVDSRKVFYRSNRGGKDPRALEFATDVPLWPGTNMVTVVARSTTEVKSIKRMFVFRDPPRTASKP